MPIPQTDAAAVIGVNGQPLISADDVAEYFGISRARLIHALYRAPDETRYREFEIPKRTGGMRRISSPRGLVRDQVNDLIHNQTDLTVVNGAKGGLFNTLVIGASYTQEDYSIENAQLLRNIGGATPNPAQPPISLSNPNTIWTGPVDYVRTGNNYGDTRNLAIYAFDTLEISPMFKMNAGVRYESVRTVFRADTVTTPATGAFSPPARSRRWFKRPSSIWSAISARAWTASRRPSATMRSPPCSTRWATACTSC